MRVTLRIWYASERPDLDEAVVLDVLQDRYGKAPKDAQGNACGPRPLLQSGFTAMTARCARSTCSTASTARTRAPRSSSSRCRPSSGSWPRDALLHLRPHAGGAAATVTTPEGTGYAGPMRDAAPG